MTSSWDGEVIQMNAITDIESACRWATRIEDAEARALGLTVEQARPRVANRLGVAPGTLENIRRLRSKIVPNWLMTRIRAEFVAVLEAEIGRLQHEIIIARQTGVDPREDILAKAEAQLVETKKILAGAT